jgi:hypothetical protein
MKLREILEDQQTTNASVDHPKKTLRLQLTLVTTMMTPDKARCSCVPSESFQRWCLRNKEMKGNTALLDKERCNTKPTKITITMRLPFPPPGFPKIRAKWLSSAGEATVIEDMKLRLGEHIDLDRKGHHRTIAIVTLEACRGDAVASLTVNIVV